MSSDKLTIVKRIALWKSNAHVIMAEVRERINDLERAKGAFSKEASEWRRRMFILRELDNEVNSMTMQKLNGTGLSGVEKLLDAADEITGLLAATGEVA